MTDIYELHAKSFANVSAYCIAKDGERVATVAFKFPKDGVGRLYAYVHWLGVPMVRGQASGYGYDKRSAAVANAIGKVQSRSTETSSANIAAHKAFAQALDKDGGEYWDDRLRKAGFDVWQAV